MRCLLTPILFAATVLLLRANPTGGAVAAGSASIAGQGSSTVTINQASHTAIINWNTFSIGSGETTNFLQPSTTSATLNKVLGGQTSFINGTLSANGQIYLINGNGIVVGPGGIIAAAGFTASTRDISDYDFKHGKLRFTGSNDAGVTNLGTITALGGNVVLIGKTVDNKGTINATGTAGLIAGDDVLLAQKNADGSTITVNPVGAPSAATGKVGVKNSGTITASTAELKAANGNIYALAIENTGLVRATTVTQQGGHIYLTADSGTIVNSGTLDASATAAKGQGGTIVLKSATGKVSHSGKILARGGTGGTGGQVEISAAQVAITGTVDTTADGGTTGNLLLDPDSIDVISGGGTDPTASTVDPVTVDSLLNSTGLTLSASNNITISDAVSWDSANNFVLETTVPTSTINIDAGITNTHALTGSLIIDAAAATDVVSTSINGTINVPNFILQRGAWVQLVNVDGNGGDIPQTLVNGTLTNVLPAFTATNDFEIDNGTFLRADSGNGGSTYYGLEDVYGLQGMEGFLTSNFTLNGNTIYGSQEAENNTAGFDTATWNSGLGFAPIGSSAHPYEGEFDNGTIEGLTIDRPGSSNVGLFGVLGSSAQLWNLSFYDFTVTGGANVGVLAGTSSASLDDTDFYSVTDTVSCTVTGSGLNVGGLVGVNDGDLYNVYADSGSVSGTQNVGGIAGSNSSTGQLQDDNNYYLTVTGTSYVGGAAGYNDGTIYSYQGISYEGDGSVEGQMYVGGVAGFNDVGGTITLSANSGSVTGDDSNGGSSYIGGIAGENDGTVTGSYTFPGATVSGNYDVGGVVGYNTGTISDSYNSATVTGTSPTIDDVNQNDSSNIGGIAGENDSIGGEEFYSFSSDSVNQPEFTPSPGIIQTSYNTGTVDGNSAVGGIAGLNDETGTITTCYNVGAIGDPNAFDAGGIVGDNYGDVTSTYDSGPVSGQTETAAGLIGYDEDSADTENSYWDTVTSGQSFATNSNEGAYEAQLAAVSSNNGTAYTTSGNGTMIDGTLQSTGYGFFGAATEVAGTNGVYEIGTSPDSGGGPAWYIIEGQTRPLLAMEANNNINSPHQLQLMAENLGGGYDITSNLDMSVVTNPAEIWNTAGFVPIGTVPNSDVDAGPITYAFTGSVYGNGEQISGLSINRPETDDVGLFGYTGSGAMISDVVLSGSSIIGNNNVGGIVGDNDGTVTYSQNNSGDGGEGVGVFGNGNNVGGIAGLNDSDGEISEDINNGSIQGIGGSSSAIGGLAGKNLGFVEQSINEGAIGAGSETDVGGLVGDNAGTVDNSYEVNNQSLNGDANLGGLVGLNESAGVLETSYVESNEMGGEDSGGPTTGAVVGTNNGIIQHVYWETDYAMELAGIGHNNNTGGTSDVRGLTFAEMSDATNYMQGTSPDMWDFSPQTGDGGGVWGISVYTYEGETDGELNNGLVDSGLPVLQWQYPVNTQVAVVGGSEPYGYTLSYNVTGEGAMQFSTQVPTLTYTYTGNGDAGDTQQVAISGTPNTYNYNVEYLDATVNVEADPLDITANSFVVASGSPTPTLTVTYTGFQPGHDASDLDGSLEYTVTPLPDTAVGQHTITVTGQTSPIGDQEMANYDITYFTGILNVTTTNPTPSQIASTFTGEIASLQNQFGNDPYNGLDPLFFMTIPNQVTLGGDLFGAINDKRKDTDYANASSTSNLPSFARLVTPGTGVVEIINGVVVIGDPQTGKPMFLNQPGTGLSQTALTDLRGVLSPSVYNELLALIHAP